MSTVVDLLFLLMVALAAAPIIALLADKKRLVQAPTFLGLVILGFIAPQTYDVMQSVIIEPRIVARFVLMIVIIQLCFYLGWQSAVQKRFFFSITVQHWYGSRLAGAALLLTAFGSVFSVWLATLPIQMTGVSTWTGLPTILFLFSKAQSLGLAASILGFARTRSKLFLWLLIANSALILPPALFYARREALLEYFIIVAVGLWFGRGWVPNRITIVAIAASAVIYVSAIAEIRNILITTTKEGYLTRDEFAVSELMMIEVNLGGAAHADLTEVGSAARAIDAIAEQGGFTFGSRAWDTLVFAYVPGQLVGHKLKNDLQIHEENIPAKYDVPVPSGTVLTAASDLFEAFHFLGAFVYLFVGRAFGALYARARSGSIRAQYLYAVTIALLPLSITHGALVFVARLPYILVFSAAAFRLAGNFKAHGSSPSYMTARVALLNQGQRNKTEFR